MCFSADTQVTVSSGSSEQYSKMLFPLTTVVEDNNNLKGKKNNFTLYYST